MKTTLHYQVKDFKRFVLENLEKRGYVLAPGTEPMMVDMDNLDDPEQVVIEVLVEERLEAVFNQLEPYQVLPAALPPPSPALTQDDVQPVGKYKQDQDLTEDGLSKTEAKRAKWRKAAQTKREKKLAAAQAEAKNHSSETLQERVEKRGAEVVAARVDQGVVAPTEVPFQWPR